MLGAVELGGTKCVAAIGDADGHVVAETRVPTTSVGATLGALVSFFEAQRGALGLIEAIGIGSFGPLDLDPASPRHGWITTTPKPGWADTDVAGWFRTALGVPVAIDTDVNAAALGEWRHGAARGADVVVYVTVGTGIGGGVLVHGQPLHGLVHPEIGHLRVPHDRVADPFEGVCPYHGDCLEGLASGPAMAARWGQPAETLPASHPGWELEARYLALALHNVVCTLSPQRIVLGGGVMTHAPLASRVRLALAALLGGYVQATAFLHAMDQYVVEPGLGTRSGLTGALELAARFRSGVA